MTVRRLITALKKMPQDVQVFTANHDNKDFETSGYADNVSLIVKNEKLEEWAGDPDLVTLESMPKKFVVIR